MTVRLDYEEYDLGSKTWQEAETAIPAADFVLLPVGSIEQHSHHLPVSVDTLRAENLTRILAEQAAERDLTILRMPTLPYGYSEHHMTYPGTITLDADTFQSVVVDIGASVVDHGAKRLAIANFHGGNEEPIKLAADRLQRDHDLRTYPLPWTDFVREDLIDRFGDEWGHAGDHETSAIELFHPELVDEASKETQTRRAEYDIRQYTYFDDITEQGGLGDPTAADPDFMEDIVETATDRILDALESDIDLEQEFDDLPPAERGAHDSAERN